jgi:hypothetical protein
MGAPKGNQFWKQRSKHGRDKLFASPGLLWEAACEYFDFCDANPWVKIDFKGANIERVEIPTARPYTLSGLCLYLDCASSYFRHFKSTIQENNKDFVTVISKIEEVIYTHQFEGAIVGAFNSNIIARALGLTEKSEVKTTIKIGKDFEDETYD